MNYQSNYCICTMHLQLIVDVIFVRDVKDIDDFLVFFLRKGDVLLLYKEQNRRAVLAEQLFKKSSICRQDQNRL